MPAPNRLLLPLAVGAPELSHWLVVIGLVVGIAIFATPHATAVGRTTIALTAAAVLLAASPLVRAPFAVRRFNQRMSTLGPGALAPAHRRPIVFRELWTGVTTGEARIVRGIQFAAPGGVPLTLDVYRPPSPGRYPPVVQIYGGAWQRGEPGDDAIAAGALASHGFVVFAVDYRHAPQWQWPAQIEDVRAALAWVRAHGSKYEADVSRLALIGRSAGAQLAMVAAYEPSAPPISAVVSFYGPVDLVDGYRNPPVPDPLDVRAIERAFLGGTPEEVPEHYRTASPSSYVSRRLPPSLLIYGGRDNIVLPRFGSELADRLRAVGATAVLVDMPWAGHAFDKVPHGLSGQLSLFYTERFLAWAFGRSH